MNELRCNCSTHKPLILKYDHDVVEGQCRKCKKKHVLGLIDGKIQEIPEELIDEALRRNIIENEPTPKNKIVQHKQDLNQYSTERPAFKNDLEKNIPKNDKKISFNGFKKLMERSNDIIY